MNSVIPTLFRYALVLIISVLFVSGCSSSNDPNSGESQTATDVILFSFDISVPVYQSNELSLEVVWGDFDLTAEWVGGEFWTVSSEFPTETEELLTVTFFDNNGAIKLGSFSQQFRTSSNAGETFLITTDQFDVDRFDDDGDGVSNLDELIAGTDPLVDEDSILEVLDFYALSTNVTTRLSVSKDFESRLSEDRPFFDTYEPNPETPSSPERISGSADIDAQGNGTLTYNYAVAGNSRRLNGTRINSGSSITWEGRRIASDEDYGHDVYFSNTVTVLDENSRRYVEEITANNIGTYAFRWQVSSNLTGNLVEGTSFCEAVAGTVSETFQSTRDGNSLSEDSDTTVTTVSKEIDDPYWRVIVENDDAETIEYFVRKLLIYQTFSNSTGVYRPEDEYFICDFVDI